MPAQKIILTNTGGTKTVPDSSIFNSYIVTIGNVTMLSSAAMTMSSPKRGQRIRFEYIPGTVNLNGNHISFMGVQMPDDYASKKVNVDCYYDGSAWAVDFTPAFQESDIITSDMVKSVAVAKVTGTASRLMEFTAGGIGQASDVTAAEAAVLNGVTAGTAAAGKAVVLTTGKVIDEIDITTLKKGGTSVTATAAELNKLSGVTATTAEINALAGVTAGTAAASKAVVLDASSKIDALDITVLSINGQTVQASGTELSELNGAGVVHADFEVLAGADSAGVAAADLQLLAGLDAAAVTNDDFLNIKAESAAKAQRKTATQTNDYTIDDSTQVVCLTLTADSNITLPDGSTNSKQFIHVIIVANAASAFTPTFLDTGATFKYNGSDYSDSLDITTPAAGTSIFLSNSGVNTWTVAKAS